MEEKDLYEIIKNSNITEVSKDLVYQIERKGHTAHKITSFKQYLSLYAFHSKKLKLSSNITYEEFKNVNPNEFKTHLVVLKYCIDRVFQV